MSDELTLALIGLGGVIVGGLIAVIGGFVVAKVQIEAGREERKAAEGERSRIRLEEAARDERRERVQPIRRGLDAIVAYQHKRVVAGMEIDRLTAQGKSKEEAEDRVLGEPTHQEAMLAAMEEFQVAFARAPALLSIELIRFVQVVREENLGKSARLTILASRVHAAIEQYVATGTVDGQDPDMKPTEEERQKMLELAMEKMGEMGIDLSRFSKK